MCVPISCAIWTSWSPITLTVTPSTSRRAPAAPRPGEPQDPVGEHAQLLAGKDERGRVELLDDRRAAQRRAPAGRSSRR